MAAHDLHFLPEFAHVHWVNDAIQASHALLPLSPQSFPALGSFPVSQLFVSPGQSVGASASASVLPVNIQGWFPLGWTGLISFRSKGLSRVFQPHNSKVFILPWSTFFLVLLSHPYTTTGKAIALTIRTFVGKVMSLLSNMLSRFVIAFFPRSKRLLISWLQSASPVTLEPKKIKTATISTLSPSIFQEVIGLDVMILVIWMWSFKPAFSLSSFSFIKRLFSSSLLSAIRLLIFSPAILIPACDQRSSNKGTSPLKISI